MSFTLVNPFKAEVCMLGWSDNPQHQVLFHNACMECAYVALRCVSERRAHIASGAPADAPADAPRNAHQEHEELQESGDVAPPAGRPRA